MKEMIFLKSKRHEKQTNGKLNYVINENRNKEY
jgi:hypothetical protein